MSLELTTLGFTTRGFTTLSFFRSSALVATLAALTTVCCCSASLWAVSITDGFGDADRNNDGSIAFYDTDVNLNDASDTTANGIVEVTAATDATDTGIVWSATRGFTSSNTGDPKANLKIINDDVAVGAETSGQIHNNGLALGYEAKGTGSSMVGNFGQSIVLGPNVGDKIVVSIDFRFWRESNNSTGAPNPGQLRWGLFQDTDSQFGMTDDVGLITGGVQEDVVWGQDDGDWRSNSPGPEGDRGIWTRVPLGPTADPEDSRINYEYNLANINGTSNNGRFLEGNGVSDTPGSGGDLGTVASASGGQDGPGAIVGALGPHTLSMEIIRLESTIEVATFINGVEALRDDIKPTDTGAAILGAAPESFDYIAFRNASGDSDYVFDNFSIQNVAIPEPASMLLLGLGGMLALTLRRRR